MTAASSPLLLRRSLSLAPQQQQQQQQVGSPHLHQRFGKPPQRQISNSSSGGGGGNSGNMSREQLAQRLRHNWAIRDTQQQQQSASTQPSSAGHHDALFSTMSVGKLATAVVAGGGNDTDLTNLGWLQNMNLMKLTPPTPPASPRPPFESVISAATAAAEAASAAASAVAVLGSEVILVEQTVADSLQFYTQLSHQQQQQQQQQSYGLHGSHRPSLHRAISSPAFQHTANASQYMNHQMMAQLPQHYQLHHQQQQQQQQHQFLIHEQQLQQQQQQSLIQLPPTAPPIPPQPDPEFAADPSLRPPYSFSTMIYMALKSLSKSKMTLQEICNWIGAHFAFYGCSADQSWQSGVRYNLTLNRCFQRVPRRKDEAASRGGGGGACSGYWRLNPEYAVQLEQANAQQQTLLLQPPQGFQAPAPSAGSLKRQRSGQHHQHHPMPPLHHLDDGFHLGSHRRHESPLLSDQPAAAKQRRVDVADGRGGEADQPDASGHWVTMALSGGPVETRLRDSTLITQPAAAAAAATAVSVAATTSAAAAATSSTSVATSLTSSTLSLTSSSSTSTEARQGASVHNGAASAALALPAGLVGIGDIGDDERWLFEPEDDGCVDDPTPALDMSNPDSLLDLTLHGMALPPPSWWLNNGGASQQQQQQLNGSLNGLMIGLPSTPSPLMHHEQDEWVDENLGDVVGSLDNLLGL